MQFNFSLTLNIRQNVLYFMMILIISFTSCQKTFAAGSKFQGSWRTSAGGTGTVACADSGRTCAESGEKTIGGYKVSKPCWRYTYTKTCSFPSRNDCSLIAHCYEIRLKECLLYDSLGNCVNQRKEFSCKRRTMGFTEDKVVRQNPKGDEANKIVCSGIPCIDGNCVDKSYEMDTGMMESVSQLYAASKTAGAKDMGFKLFEGFSQSCSKKPGDYLNCCKVKGWGGSLGASCNVDERKLQDLREKNLCVYTGKTTTGTKPFHVNKHQFCCFGNMLNKVFQVEARKQLGMSFGSGGSPDCRGLTLNEITRLDFEKLDLSEFVLDMKNKMKVPNIGDIKARVTDSIPSIRKFDEGTPNLELNPEASVSGLNTQQISKLQDEGEYAK